MRVMAFSATVRAILGQQKTVTRRCGRVASELRPGDLIRAVNQILGLGRGGKARTLAVLRVEETGPSTTITEQEVAAEGFPGRSPDYLLTLLRQMYGHDLQAVDSAAPGGAWPLVRIRFSYVAVAAPEFKQPPPLEVRGVPLDWQGADGLVARLQLSTREAKSLARCWRDGGLVPAELHRQLLQHHDAFELFQSKKTPRVALTPQRDLFR